MMFVASSSLLGKEEMRYPMTATSKRAGLRAVPMLPHESLYVGIDVGKARHIAGFVSRTLLERHERFEACPVLSFENSRAGFRVLVERIREYVPAEQCFLLLEDTGHYHRALVQYLLELDLAVYRMHVQQRQKGMPKTDKRDALGLANHLYNQLELGVQMANKKQLVRRAVPPAETAALLRGLIRHRYELSHESTRRKNKLIAITDELFPEFTQVLKDPTSMTALALRERFPTPHTIATASLEDLCKTRAGARPSKEKLVLLQQLAAQSIGIKDLGRQRGLVLEQQQLIRELRLLQEHIAQLEQEITQMVAQSREGRILTSIPPIGPIQAAALIASIGHIDNFRNAAALKSYLGWAPIDERSGTSLEHVHQTHGGTRPGKKMIFLIVGNAIQMRDSEWAKLYQRLLPRKCRYNERQQDYQDKLLLVGRLAGQLIEMIFAFLKIDADLLKKYPPGGLIPEPMLYDQAIHQAHRQGQYHPLRPDRKPNTIVDLSDL
jgi:transposase